MKLDKHFTATTYLLHEQKPLTLLHFHNKLQTWLPPGGHLEINETPLEAAIREIIEETGLSPENINFIPNGEKPRKIDDRAEYLALPHHLLSELIEEGHYHLDWIYFARINENDFDKTKRPEEFKWFSISELHSEEEIFENVRKLAIDGIEKFSQETYSKKTD